MIEYTNVVKSCDAHFTVPTYNFQNHLMNFDFDFKVNIPKPNKERSITERDSLGRILRSRVV